MKCKFRKLPYVFKSKLNEERKASFFKIATYSGLIGLCDKIKELFKQDNSTAN